MQLPPHRCETHVRIQPTCNRIVLANFQTNPPCTLLLCCVDRRFDHRAANTHSPVLRVDNHVADHLASVAAGERVAQRKIPDDALAFDPDKAGRLQIRQP